MLDKVLIKAQILEAFANVEYPGDWCLRRTNEGEEPNMVAKAFLGKSDWRLLDVAFIDRAPEGLSSALSFFSDEAFRFYLPAYLIADLDGQLHFTDPAVYLCQGLSDSSRNERISHRFGARTWFDESKYRFSTFFPQEASAVVAYLRWRLQAEESNELRDRIDQALLNYWLPRTGQLEV